MSALVHALAPPVGLVVVRISPATLLSPTMHSETDGHATGSRYAPLSTVVFCHVLAPPVGFVEVKTSPTFVVATHSETDGHDTASTISLPDAMGALLQEPAPPVGSIDVRIVGPPWVLAPPPPTTHSETDGHETA